VATSAAIAGGSLSAMAADSEPDSTVIEPTPTTSAAPDAGDESPAADESPAPEEATVSDVARVASTPTYESTGDYETTYPGDSGGGTGDCVSTPMVSYTWNGPAGTGTVVVTGGDAGQALCTPLFVRAASYSYVAPVSESAPSYPQSIVGFNDYTVDTVGTFEFETPGVECGADVVYATFNYTAFNDLELAETLDEQGTPWEPTRLDEVVDVGEGGPTTYADSTYGCGGGGVDDSRISIVKSASTATITAGESFDYTLQVRNEGTSAASPVVVTDTLPAAVTVDGAVSAPGWVVEQNTDLDTGLVTFTFTLDTLEAETDAPAIVIPVVVSETSGSDIANTATACAPGAAQDETCVSDSTVVIVKSVALTATPGCLKDVPVATYAIAMTPAALAANPTVTFEWVAADGAIVETVTVPAAATMNGSLVWPGAAFDAVGNATDWPGWSFVSGHWVKDTSDLGSNLRPSATLRMLTTPAASVQVAYPIAAMRCAGPTELTTFPLDDGVLDDSKTTTSQLTTLAMTGSQSSIPLLVSGVLFAFGLGFIMIGVTRRNRRATD
jgi:uncharacterized repeat protein (TIGR01451 family)